MKIKSMFILISIITLLLTSGCSDTESVIMNQKIKEDRQKGEIVKKELLTEGLIIELDNTVKIGDDEVTIKEIVFDTNFFTVTYEISKQLSSLNMKISGDTKEIKRADNFNGFQSNNTSPDFYTSPSLSTVSVPHNLKLINQRVSLEIEVNNSYKNISIEFPGDKIALLTKELLFNKQGEQVKDIKLAIARVRVGINSLEIESKGFYKELVVLDLKEKRLLSRTSSVYSGENAIENFVTIPIHRKDINVKLLYSDKVILVNY